MNEFENENNIPNSQPQQNNQNDTSDSVYSYSYADIHQEEDVNTSNSGENHTTDGTASNTTYEQATSGAPKRKRKFFQFRKKYWPKVIATAAVFGLVASAVFQGSNVLLSNVLGTDEQTSTTATLATSTGAIGTTATSTATTITDVSEIVENTMPAVVAVTNISITEYRTVFGQTGSYQNKAVGSGIIISQDNENIYIATNNHVVSGASELTITFNDESVASAMIKGTDSSTDLAVVSVALSDLSSETMSNIKVATVGESSSVVVGESAIVIGNAMGYGQSVTTGVISALEREVSIQDDSGSVVTNKLIQTDAAVNPGNSGGALLNMNGEVIGIVSAKYTDTDVEGMGYAIPISNAASIIEQILNNEVLSEDEASYLGISGVDVTSSVAAQYDMPEGVYVSRVASSSGAGKAGIQKGDVITSFNGTTVTSMNQIQSMMQYLPAGTKIEVVVAQASNEYKETTLEVTLGKKSAS